MIGFYFDWKLYYLRVTIAFFHFFFVLSVFQLPIYWLWWGVQQFYLIVFLQLHFVPKFPEFVHQLYYLLDNNVNSIIKEFI